MVFDGERSTMSSAPLPDQVLDNVLETVLHFITSRHDRNAASLVCKSWFRAEAQTRSKVYIGNCYAVSPNRTVQRFRRVRTVFLKGRPRFADFGLVPVGWGGNLSPWIAVMSPAYPWLEKLCLKRMTVTNENLYTIATSFAHFKELLLNCCDGFGTAGIAVQVFRFFLLLPLIRSVIGDCESFFILLWSISKNRYRVTGVPWDSEKIASPTFLHFSVTFLRLI